MREIDDAEFDKMPSEPETTNVENIEEIVFEGNEKKYSYNVDVIDEHLKNRDTSENATDAFSEWRKQFLSKVSKPVPDVAQVKYLQFEKVKPSGRILYWMFVKEIHCITIKREFGIQYFSLLLCILSLPFYDVAALTKLKLHNRSNFEGATLFEKWIKFNKKVRLER
ncbi:hypothetical protein Hanom_Chr05g00442001 [Helianthus anomalus]